MSSVIAGVLIAVDSEPNAELWCCGFCDVILRLKRYQPFAPQTVPLFLLCWLRAVLVLFDLTFFGIRPGLRFGTV